MTKDVPTRLDGVRRAALLAAVIGCGLCIAALIADRHVFFESYLVGALFWLGVSLGCGAMVMTYHLTGGRWGDAVAGVFESGVAVLPLMALLFIPVLLGVRSLYVWTNPAVVRLDPRLIHKSIYLKVGGFFPPGFVVRTVIYFVLWLVGGYLLVRWGDLRRRTGDAAYSRRLTRLSGAGLVIYVLTMTLAGFDWVMSLEPTWYSTIFGFIIVVGQGLAAIGVTTITYVFLTRGMHGMHGATGPHSGGTPTTPGAATEVRAEQRATRGVLYDLGNLLLMGVALWAYMQFSQFLIIYYGNLPEETSWYQARARGWWWLVSVALIVFHFAVPLALLLSRWLKQQAMALLWIALGLVAMQCVSDIWMTIPAFTRVHWWPTGLDVAAVVGIGGLWVLMFTTQLQRRPMWAVVPPAPAPPRRGH